MPQHMPRVKEAISPWDGEEFYGSWAIASGFPICGSRREFSDWRCSDFEILSPTDMFFF
jgi:hypothetical protein